MLWSYIVVSSLSDISILVEELPNLYTEVLLCFFYGEVKTLWNLVENELLLLSKTLVSYKMYSPLPFKKKFLFKLKMYYYNK